MCRLRCKKGDFVELAYEEKCYISKIEGSSSVSRVYGKVLDDMLPKSVHTIRVENKDFEVTVNATKVIEMGVLCS